jgi:hypothetical protein
MYKAYLLLLLKKVIFMKKYLLAIVLMTMTAHIHAQSTEDSVKAVINQLFISMRNADSTGVVNCFSEKNILQTIVRDKDGNISARSELLSNFGRSIAGLQKNAADERIEFQTIKIDGPLASVWTPYKFYFNGSFSHCGVNSFQLLREKNGWKIHYLIDTRRKEPCEK